MNFSAYHVARMCEEARDEMSVLSAIFCEKDEFELIEESGEVNKQF